MALINTDQHNSATLTTSLEDSWTDILVSSTSSPLSNMTSFHGTNDIARFTECPWELSTCRAQKYLFLVVSPLLVLMSTIGNALGLAVMTRKSLRRTATAVFISSLAVSDTVAVWTGLSRHFVRKLTTYDIRQYSEWTCRFQRFVLYMSLDTSSWILAAISIERFLAVCMPQRHKVLLKSTSRAWKVVVGILIFMAMFNCNVFFTYGEQTVIKGNETTTFACGFSSNSSRKYLTTYHSWISLTVYCVIPFCVMLSLNLCIIARLKKMQRSFRARSTASTSSRSQINTFSMTKMLLCVTFYFIIITTPAFIFAILQEWLFDTVEITTEKKGRMELADAILTLMLYLNHSVNFFLYCVSGRKFKRELIELLSCCKKQEPAEVIPSTSETPFMLKSKSAVSKPLDFNSINQ